MYGGLIPVHSGANNCHRKSTEDTPVEYATKYFQPYLRDSGKQKKTMRKRRYPRWTKSTLDIPQKYKAMKTTMYAHFCIKISAEFHHMLRFSFHCAIRRWAKVGYSMDMIGGEAGILSTDE